MTFPFKQGQKYKKPWPPNGVSGAANFPPAALFGTPRDPQTQSTHPKSHAMPDPRDGSLIERPAVEIRLAPHEKVALLCKHFPARKPSYREVLHVRMPSSTDTLLVFRAGKALAYLAPYCLEGGRTKALDASLRSDIEALPSFLPWIDELKASRSAGPMATKPDLQEQVRMLVQAWPRARPKPGETIRVTRSNGLQFDVDGNRLLRKIAPNWFGKATKHNSIDAEHKRLVEGVAWGEKWIDTGRHRRRVSLLRRAFPVDFKLKLLAKHYNVKPDGSPGERPSWKDTIPCRIPKSFGGGVWEFRPAWLLDDMHSNWVEGGKPGVVLSEQQKGMLEQLPWVERWVADVRASHAKREKKRAGAVLCA